MKKIFVSMLSLSLLVLVLTGVSHGWQGKLAGMGDPSGLVQDESDFLTHPALIAAGKGSRFYQNYRFTYTEVTDWDYKLDRFNTAGTLTDFYQYDTSGDERKHEALLGSAFPIGAGRMGVFLSYDGIRGDYDGHEDRLGTSHYGAHDLAKDLDIFALRLLFGLPLGGVNLGGEVQIAHRREENKNRFQTSADGEFLNYILSTASPETNLLPFQSPYDSRYWEALLKGSLDGAIGSVDLQCTLWGGFVFAGDNRLRMNWAADPSSANLEGDVKGWRTGGDLWVRYPLGGGFSLPFLVRIDYRDTTRDAKGPGQGNAWSTLDIDYKTQRRDLRLVVGGGVDTELGTGSRIAAGIYYGYLRGKNEINLHSPLSNEYYDNSDCPLHTEQRVMARFAGEHALTPVASLRAGLDVFYGRVGEDFTFTIGDPVTDTDAISLDGSKRGIGASVGFTVESNGFTEEFFLNAGYQELDMDGDGTRTGITAYLYKMEKSRSEWYIGGGISVLFDL